jgi:multiple sugar transport system substrate-binding protein
MAMQLFDDAWQRSMDRGSFLRGAAKVAAGVTALGLGVEGVSFGPLAEAAGMSGPLTFWNLAADGYEQPDKVGFLDPFRNSYPQVHLKVQYVPWQVYLQKILTLSAAGTAPDVYFASIAWIYDLAKKGAAQNLDSYIKASHLPFSKYYNEFDGLRYPDARGSLYAIPYEWVTIVLYYNKAIFDKARIPYPDASWTYDTYRRVAQELTVRKGGKTVQYGCTADWGYDTSDSLLHSNGGTLLSADNRKCTFNSAQNIASVQYLLDLVYKYKVAPSPAQYTPQQGAEQLFMSGKIAMMIGGVWIIGDLRQQSKIPWDITMLPMGKVGRRVINWPNQYVIASTSKNKEAAWKLIELALRPDRPANTFGPGKVPIIRADTRAWLALDAHRPPKHESAIVEQAKYNVPLQAGPAWSEWRAKLDNTMQGVFLRHMTPQQGVVQATQAIQTVLDQFWAS